jgi:serine/threonine protein kinase
MQFCVQKCCCAFKCTHSNNDILHIIVVFCCTRCMLQLNTEIKIHRTLLHQHIVHFELYFEDPENVYILLELCHNHTLSELIRKNKRFAEEDAKRYMIQMLHATNYCHANGIIHRDLKLGNLFLDSNWNIKMGDFGLAAKLSDDSERKKTVCGTPNYIAPEILEPSTTGHSYQVLTAFILTSAYANHNCCGRHH